MKWKKNISCDESRQISYIFCENFKIDPCYIWYVDRLPVRGNLKCYLSQGYMGLYFGHQEPSHILVATIGNWNKIGVLIHELTHHLEYEAYEKNDSNPVHGYNYQLAKERVVSWARKEISDKANWYLPLKAKLQTEEMAKFKM